MYSGNFHRSESNNNYFSYFYCIIILAFQCFSFFFIHSSYLFFIIIFYIPPLKKASRLIYNAFFRTFIIITIINSCEITRRRLYFALQNDSLNMLFVIISLIIISWCLLAHSQIESTTSTKILSGELLVRDCTQSQCGIHTGSCSFRGMYLVSIYFNDEDFWM